MRIASRTPAIALLLVAACGGSEHSAPPRASDDAGDDAARPMRTICSRRSAPTRPRRRWMRVLFEKLVGARAIRSTRSAMRAFVRRSPTRGRGRPIHSPLPFISIRTRTGTTAYRCAQRMCVYSYRMNISKDVGSPVGPLLAGIDSVTARDSLTAGLLVSRTLAGAVLQRRHRRFACSPRICCRTFRIPRSRPRRSLAIPWAAAHTSSCDG